MKRQVHERRTRRPRLGWLALVILPALVAQPQEISRAAMGISVVAEVPALAASRSLEIPILAYHKIDRDAPTEWYVTADQFAMQVEVLEAYGYQTVGLEDLLKFRSGEADLPEKPVIITFDDGFQGVYVYARPILKAHGMTATFFVPTGKIAETAEKRQANDWQPDEPPAYHLIWPEIEEMSREGFTIGSHSVTHPVLNAISLSQARTEIIRSRREIQEHLPGEAALCFAYPYGEGADDEAIRSLVKDAGYQAAVRYGPDDGPVDLASADLWALPRPAITREVSLRLEAEDPWWFFMRRLDPDFPLPAIVVDRVELLDAWGTRRSAFYPGEVVTVSVHTSNWGQAANVRGSLVLRAADGVAYDSHLRDAQTELVLRPLRRGKDKGAYLFSWTTPQVTETETYTYSLIGRDSYGLLEYYSSPVRPVFTVQPSPVGVVLSPQPLGLGKNETKEISLRVYSKDSTAFQMRLGVSLSPGLTVGETSQGARWNVIPPGSWVEARGCSGPCIQSTYLIAETEVATFGEGEKTFLLPIRRLPSSGDDEWIQYRLAIRVAGQVTPYCVLRDPLGGWVDQQGYFARRLQLSLPSPFRFPRPFTD